jgi:hypothetical protein
VSVRALFVRVALVSVLVLAGVGVAVTAHGRGPLEAVGAGVDRAAASPAFGLPPSPNASPAESDAVGAPPRLAVAEDPTVPFAHVGPLALRLPVPEPVLIAYHEATYRIAAALQPFGRCTKNDNPFKGKCPARSTGPRYLIQYPRARPTAPTSAVDVVVHGGEWLRSPVDGVVLRVTRYGLYGRWPDIRIEIAPSGFPRLRVILLHVTNVRVLPGDRLVAGRTQIAFARLFPFRPNVDGYYQGGPYPHVHVEVSLGDPVAAAAAAGLA